MQQTNRAARGFTLIELMVVIGIIGALIAILFPVLRSARRSARDVTCASNMRQIATALIAYAGQSKGAFPPNSAEIGQFWYLESIIGPHVTAPDRVARAGAVPAGADKGIGLAGGIFVCPNDLEDSVRSFSMNVFASSAVNSRAAKQLESDNPPGKLFKHGGGSDSSHLLLVVESWPELPVKGTTPTKYVAQAIVGRFGKPGQRFGGGTGIVWRDAPDATPGRFDVRASHITFYRHARSYRKMEEPKGQANFAFVDGHVEMLRQDQLVRQDGESSYLAMWSPIDREVEAR